MKKLGNLIVFFVVVGIIVHNVSDGIFGGSSKSNPTTAPSQPSRSDSPTDINAYATRIERNNWPPQNAQQALANNLLANNYYLVLDGSGSMSESRCSGGQSKMAVAKNAVSQFVGQIPQNANVGLFVFDKSGVKERVPLSPKNPGELDRAVSGVQAGGGTPLSVAVQQGFAALTQQAQKQLGYGEYNLVVITDGEASKNYEPRGAVNQLLENSPVVLHTIGFCIGEQHSLNQPGLAFYKAADDSASLAAGLNEVLAELNDFTTVSFSE